MKEGGKSRDQNAGESDEFVGHEVRELTRET